MSAQGLSAAKFQEVAKNEANVLTRFREKGHPHLIRAIASYTKERRHFFVFPWAKGGNLREFWKSQPSLSTASLSFSVQDWADYLNWFFSQLTGLAGAIKTLHYPPNESGHSCRHGDLKPENILCFGRHEPGPGAIPRHVKLIIADAGHASVHEQATAIRLLPTKTQGGTRMYSPPEAELQLGEARSRRYDIWSLGCLYFEFLIWILYGNTVLNEFHSAIGNGQPYYDKDEGVELKDTVKDWIVHIRGDPRCLPSGLTALGRLLDLIEDRLLVVNIKTRINSFSQYNGMRHPSSSSGNIPDMVLTRPTVDIREPLPERADAKEMCEEMEKILAAAQRGGSLPWMNWDGMADAAKWGPPRVVSNLSPHSRSGSVEAAIENELTIKVRFLSRCSIKIQVLPNILRTPSLNHWRYVYKICWK